MSLEFISFARTTLVSGPGSFRDLGRHVKAAGFRRPLLVADPGMIKAGFVQRALQALESEGIVAAVFSEFTENPNDTHIESGRSVGVECGADSLVAVGGGSSLDCAKGINFLLTNGGSIKDYWGYDRARIDLLPMIGVPTTTGTGSDAQSYALISDSETHVKMAIGAPSAAFRLVILDPELAASQPLPVFAAAGYDAISHAVETEATTRRNVASSAFARQAWHLLSANFPRFLSRPGDVDAAGRMQIGAYLAGLAIEHSMLGGAHATANPLTAAYGLPHGVAIGLMLAPVIILNGIRHYSGLDGFSVSRVEDLAQAAGLPRRLRSVSVPHADIPDLASAAVQQWTGRFNPRPLDESLAKELYECAY